LTPRNLRHRLEKTAKLLVTVQRFNAGAVTDFAPDKGEHGQLIILCEREHTVPQWLGKLGRGLEGRGYAFTRTHNRWLGAVFLRGKREGSPDILIQLAAPIDRESPTPPEPQPEAFSFK